MCKASRLALTVLLGAVCALALGSTSALANCDIGIPISAGQDGSPISVAACGTNPVPQYWLVGHGDPALGAGVDNGALSVRYDLLPYGGVVTSDFNTTGVDGCPLSFFQTDGTFAPLALVMSNEFSSHTPAHSTSYAALSTDYYEPYQSGYGFDEIFGDILDGTIPPGSAITCNAQPKPTVSGPVSALVLSWPNVISLDDCATNVYSINTADDCAGGSRPLLRGWNVYYSHVACLPGTLTGDRTIAGLWTKANASMLPIGANAGTSPLSVPAAPAGKCLYLAYSPVWDSNMEGQYVSNASDPIGGTGDSDGDGRTDLTDNCALVSNASQADGDGDMIGDACDNCPGVVNYDQADFNSNGRGDACDACPDSGDLDGDTICDPVDNCPSVANVGQQDGDADGLGDACDACPLDPFNDADADGRCGNVDNCPNTANANQLDRDGDGKGDVCDPCPFEKFDDLDTDGKCACDVALGNAGVCGTYPNITDGLGHPADNCAVLYNPTQTASGFGDGLGSACEDTFSAADVFWTSFWGPCTARFKTSMEWNCPKFRVKNLGATKATFPCMECTNGRGQLASYYGGDTGVSIGKCLAGFLVWVEASRSNPNDCAGFVVPKQATKKFPYKTATRLR